MFKMKKYPLKLFAIISLAIVVLTTVVVCVFGVNTSIEIGGGSQIEINLSNGSEYSFTDEEIADYIQNIQDVLDKHNCKIDGYIVEDKLIDTYLVVRIAKTSIKNSETISSQIAQKLGIAQSRVGNVQRLSGSFTTSQMLYIGLAVIAIVVLCFFLGWWRYSLAGGITLAFAALHNFILSLALIFSLRVQFSMISLMGSIVGTLLSIFALVMIFERIRENSKSKQHALLSEDKKMFTATCQNKFLLLIAAVILVLSIVMICLPVRYIRLAGLSLQLCLLVAAYTCIAISPALYVNLAQVFKSREKQKLSKNVTTEKK